MDQQAFDYKDTLNLPTTDFPMKANLAKEELNILNFWQQLDLYNKLQEIHKDDPVFIFQDGPPYANGSIHLGHAFNRILKDFIVKSKSLSGYKVPFIPGWDCHGLPIEIKVEKELNQQSHQIDPILFITKCREYAKTQINIQKQQFIRLGVVANWQNPYITMDFKFEATVIRTLGSIMANGHLTRGDRPVHWCVNCGSALAEAEVEYKEKQSPSIYVTFDCINNQQVLSCFNLVNNNLLAESISVLIWTTTPWTLPANQAVALNPIFNYCLLHIKALNKNLIIAENLIASVVAALNLNIDDYSVLATCLGVKLEHILLQHPLYQKQVPIVMGEHVTLDAGTGCVHTAPAHGHDDYVAGKKYNLPVENFINNRGCFLEHTELFANLHINKANPVIIETLKQKNNLLAYSEILHSYPHCWRHKTPLIFMATPQWFISMEKNQLRAKALEEVNKIEWFPNWGKNRMEAMLPLGRPDWCISRQRIWGVPIPFFINNTTGELHPNQLDLLEKIAKKVETGGIEAWHQLDVKELLGVDAENYTKSSDILDVWFESGTVNCCIKSTHPSMDSYADLYLEGSDQHRGWFQSSLLVAMAANNKPPFKQVLTHGFVLDAAGNKMSKSLGNVIDPETVVNKYGADLLRLWVATTDYSGDLKISDEILKRTTDAYRRIRNTARFLLSNLHDFDHKTDILPIEKLLLLDKWMLEKTQKLQQEILKYYNDYKYHLAYQKIHNFCVEELGSFYLDVIKDRQYTCKKNSIPRRSAQSVLYHILESLVRWIAPILSFTAEEIWKYLPDRKETSVFLDSWYNYNAITIELEHKNFWDIILILRKEVNKQIELARNENKLGSSLEAEVTIYCTSEIFNILNIMPNIKQEFKFILISSNVEIIKDDSIDNINKFVIAINCSNNPKCARCWHRVKDVNESNLCNRCTINLTTEAGETRIYV
jgi:isoleucyl-tRNA synthetase